MSILGKRFGIEVEFKDANMDDLALVLRFAENIITTKSEATGRLFLMAL